MQQDPIEKKYIEVIYSPESQGYLLQYCLDNNFDLTSSWNGRLITPEEFQFHTTIWYTANEVQITNGTTSVIINDIKPTGFTLFNENGLSILVLEIESEQLRFIRTAFGEQYGLHGTFPVYTPHITLSYRYKQEHLPQVDLPVGNMLIADTLHITGQQ